MIGGPGALLGTGGMSQASHSPPIPAGSTALRAEITQQSEPSPPCSGESTPGSVSGDRRPVAGPRALGGEAALPRRKEHSKAPSKGWLVLPFPLLTQLKAVSSPGMTLAACWQTREVGGGPALTREPWLDGWET